VPDKLTLAPGATALSGDDRAGLAGPVAAPVAGQGGAVALAADANAVVAPGLLPAAATVDAQAALGDGDAEAVETGPDALSADAAAPATVADAVNAAVAEALAGGGAAPAGAVTKSLVPRARPATHGGALAVVAAMAGGADAASGPEAVLAAEVDPATIPVGTELAQLGAFDTPEAARAKWAALSALYAEVMAGKSIVIQPAQSGGQEFFRLRAQGFDSEEDARRFCSVLMAGNSDCIPVAQR
jgi:hypothetical protein